MSKTFSKLLFAILMAGTGVLTAYFVSAQVSSRRDITFPVAELNNCKNETECRAYCDKPENIDACVDFAQKHGLMSQEEANKAKQFKDVAQVGGPGGCKGQNQCEIYCNVQSNMDECISFAEKHNLMPTEELAEAKKVNQALRQGAKLPGNCQGKQQCETYCKTPAHAGECLDFASKAGFIPPDQVKQARRMMELIQSGDAPQICLEGRDQCQQYCSEEPHRNQCTNFMVKAGFMKPEDTEVFKKTGGKGPGGCQSKEECEAFCNVQGNQQTCFQFGKENGLIPQDQLKQIQENSDMTKNAIEGAPQEVKQCLQSTVGSDVLQEIESGKFLPNKETGEQLGQQMQKCFEQFMLRNMQKSPNSQGRSELGSQGKMPPSASNSNNQFRGPGGCSSPEECTKYCSDPNHANECINIRGEYQKGSPQEQNHPAPPPQVQTGPPPGYKNQPPASLFPMISPSSGNFPSGGQPTQSFNPPPPLQPVQGTNHPLNTQPYSSGQPYPTTQQIPPGQPIQQIPQSSPLPPTILPTSSVGSFFASILRFISSTR